MTAPAARSAGSVVGWPAHELGERAEAGNRADREAARGREADLVGRRARTRRRCARDAMNAFASLSCTMYAISAGARCQLIGTRYQPACAQARLIAKNSAQFGSATATASPRARPSARRPCAIWFCSANSSPRVHCASRRARRARASTGRAARSSRSPVRSRPSGGALCRSGPVRLVVGDDVGARSTASRRRRRGRAPCARRRPGARRPGRAPAWPPRRSGSGPTRRSGSTTARRPTCSRAGRRRARSRPRRSSSSPGPLRRSPSTPSTSARTS